MKIFIFLLTAILTMGAAQAAPNVIVGKDDILTGGVATIPLVFQADGNTAGLDFTFSFDPSKFTAVTNCVTAVGSASVSCAVVGNTVKVFVAAPFSFPVPTIASGNQALGSVSFDADATAGDGVYPLTILESNFFDSVAARIPGTGSINGQIIITTPIQDGDANGDGVVNEADIAVVMDQFFGRSTAAGKPDCNQDGDVNSGDAICITNVALG